MNYYHYWPLQLTMYCGNKQFRGTIFIAAFSPRKNMRGCLGSDAAQQLLSAAASISKSVTKRAFLVDQNEPF